MFFIGILLSFIKILFFLDFNKSNASSSKSGAIRISKNSLLIWSAVFLSIFLLEVKTPPNADTLSQAKASS